MEGEKRIDTSEDDLKKAKTSVLKKSEHIRSMEVIKGYDFNEGVNYSKMFSNYQSMGFQASAIGKGIEIINKMINWRLIDDKVDEDESDYYKEIKIRENTKTTIFLGYTSNMASCGMREIVRYLCEHKMIDVIVTTAGGVEEDFIKCLAPTYLGDFALKGSELREKGINRIGNLLVPNENYCLFEDWLKPHLNTMLELQKTKGKIWTPSKII
jgi:deoxyhypusine synthase